MEGRGRVVRGLGGSLGALALVVTAAACTVANEPLATSTAELGRPPR